MKEILTMDDPRFEGFCEKLLTGLEDLRQKKCSKGRIPPGHFDKDGEGNLTFVIDISPFEKSQLVKKALREMENIDVEGTLRFFNAIDHFCDCEDCKKVLDIIRPMDINA